MGKIAQVDQQVILFDGVCNLCNTSINFIIDRDSKKLFRYASLQSDFGAQVKAQFGRSADLDSVLLLQGEQLLQKSDAALAIARQLDGLWPALSIFKIVPRAIRDAVYSWIARNRYRWFGKQDACRIPTPDLRALFLDT
ncbi:MAG: DCC1-like thiol-disulfide oxidoreductase family protein [Cyclobacteriaceae bacterium]